MFTQMASFVRKTFPIEFRLLAFSVAIGLLSGAFYLGESADLATAVGIAAGFSCAIGSWLGIRLYLVTARLFISWIDAIGNRIANVAARMALAERPHQADGCQKSHRSLAMLIVLVSAYATPVCWVIAVAGSIAAGLFTQLGPGFVASTLPIALSGAGMLLLAVGVQALYLWHLHRQVASFERMLDRIDAVSPITLKAQILNHDISRAERTVRRLTGAGKPIAEQPA